MQPYYEHKGITIYNCDAREGLESVGRFDATITSPPYNLNTRVNKNREYISRQVIPTEFSSKYDGYDDNLHPEDYFSMTNHVLELCLAACTSVFWNIQLATGNKPAIAQLIGQHAHLLKEIAIWDKGHSQPAMKDGVMNSVFEFVLIFSNDDPSTRQFKGCGFDRGTLDNVWRLQKGRSIDPDHKAAFPPALVDRCLQLQPSKRVLDPFMGTGTTLDVARTMGAEAVGFEISERYCEAAAKRLSQEVMDFT